MVTTDTRMNIGTGLLEKKLKVCEERIPRRMGKAGNAGPIYPLLKLDEVAAIIPRCMTVVEKGAKNRAQLGSSLTPHTFRIGKKTI